MKNFQLFVDDIRPAPSESTRLVARDYWTALELLEEHWNVLSLVSLDHDISSFRDGKEYTGYDVLCWIENKAAQNNSPIEFTLCIHSMNPVGRERMQKTIQSMRDRNLY